MHIRIGIKVLYCKYSLWSMGLFYYNIEHSNTHINIADINIYLKVFIALYYTYC